MSFLFNFPNPDNEGSTEETRTIGDSEPVNENLLPLEEILVSVASAESNNDLPVTEYKISEDICIQCLQSQAVEKKLCGQASGDTGTVQAALSHSDLIPNVYEGGLKVWECAIDLAQFLCKEHINFKDKTVAELGCGAGVPGIIAMLAGAAHVHFQDYNKEVIEHYTIPNVHLNTSSHCTCKCRYFSGDWDSYRDSMQKENVSYDIILTAETIYRRENYSKLAKFFKHCLSPSGTVYLAAKSNYFGVGGGTRDFAGFLEKERIFVAELCHSVGEGLPREIWKIQMR